MINFAVNAERSFENEGHSKSIHEEHIEKLADYVWLIQRKYIGKLNKTVSFARMIWPVKFAKNRLTSGIWEVTLKSLKPVPFRGVLKTLPNIYDGAFLRK